MAYGISGVVQVGGSPLSGATVVLMDRGVVPRALQRQVADGSGNYKFTGLDNAQLYTVVAYDPAGGTDYNALVWDKVAPVTMSLTDSFWENVVLLVGNDSAAHASALFTDYSLQRHEIAVFGDAQYSNAQAPSGLTTSMKFDGTGDKLQTAYNNQFDFLNNNFTIELYWYHTVSTDQALWDARTLAGAGATLQGFTSVGTPGLRIGWSGVYRITAANPGQNAWHHAAWTCDIADDVVHQWSDGVSTGTATNGMAGGIASLSIGGLGDIPVTMSFTGYIAAVRVTQAVRYTGTFTPPSLPLPTN